MGKLSCPPAVGRGGVRSSGGEKEGRKAAGERDMKTWHASELAAQKQYTPLAFPWLPCSLLHLLRPDLAVSSDHVKGSLSLPRLAGCLILREQFTSRAERQWPACLHPCPFLFSTLCDMGMPLNQAESALKCYWMLWKPLIRLKNMTTYQPGRRQMMDVRLKSQTLKCLPWHMLFLGRIFSHWR